MPFDRRISLASPTGATLNEFARMLKLHGAARVENWVAARTLPN